jgi:hypothetical protein
MMTVVKIPDETMQARPHHGELEEADAPRTALKGERRGARANRALAPEHGDGPLPAARGSTCRRGY